MAPRLSMVSHARVASADEQVDALFRLDWDSRATVLVEREPAAAGETGPALPPSARFVADGANRVVAEAEVGASGGYLVLLDSYSEDWRAMVDGRPAAIVLANGLFRAVRLAPGRHVIEFVYRPATFLLGAGLSTLAFAGLLVLLAWRRAGRA